MGHEMPPPPPKKNLTLALTPKSLEPTLVEQRHTYWEEVNPLMAKWHHVNDARCRECGRMVRVNMSHHIQLIHTAVSGSNLPSMVYQ